MKASELIKQDGKYICPTCGKALVASPGSMHFRGMDFSGLVCVDCNALWDNPDDSMMKYMMEHPVSETS